jgi:hypothetical protein
MPSFNVALPQIPKRFDLRDVVDPIDRKIEVADQAAVLLLGTLQSIKMDPATGEAYAALSYLAPGTISADRVIYEAAIDAAITAAVTALNELKSIATMV